MDQIGTLPFFGANVALEDALGELWHSREACLLVLKEDGALLFDVPDLWEVAAAQPGLLMRDIEGGTWLWREDRIPGEPESEALVVGTERDRAVVRFYSGHLYTRVSTKMYYCDQNPRKHYYDSTQVKMLTKVPGGWRCSQGDNGLVT